MNPHRGREVLESRIDNEATLDILWDELTDMQAATCQLLLYGYNQSWIANHFEVSKQRISEIMDQVRAKASKLEVV